MERHLGSITYYNTSKAFGYISGADDVSHWFHIKFVLPLTNGGRPIPKAGDLYFFELRESDRKQGFDEAFNLRKLTPQTPAATPETVGS